MSVSVFAATLFNFSASQRIPLTESLFCFNNIVYFHVMAHHRSPTEATIKYMGNHLDEYHCHNDVYTSFDASKATMKISEALKQLLTLDKQEELESDSTSKNHSIAAPHCCIGEDIIQTDQEVAQHLVIKSDFNAVQMDVLNHLSYHISQLGNLQNATSDVQESEMIDLEQLYRPWNCQEALIKLLMTKDWC